MLWIGIYTKLSIYGVPTDPHKWSYKGFGILWQSFIVSINTPEIYQGISQELVLCSLKYEVCGIICGYLI